MAVNWKGSILDTYNASSEFGSGAGPGATGFNDAKKAGGSSPITTDFIKGINPQQTNISYKGDAAGGFTANLTPADRNKTEYAMVKENKSTTPEFLPLNTTKDYIDNTIAITGYNKDKRYKKPANP